MAVFGVRGITAIIKYIPESDARVGRLDERSKHWLLNLRLKLTKFFGEWPVAQKAQRTT